MKGAKPEPLMTVDEACDYLRYVKPDGSPDRAKFYDFLRRKRPAHKKLGRSVRITKLAIDACITDVPAGPTSLAASLSLVQKTGTR